MAYAPKLQLFFSQNSLYSNLQGDCQQFLFHFVLNIPAKQPKDKIMPFLLTLRAKMRYVPVLLILTGLIIAILTGLQDYVSYAEFAANRQKWIDFVMANQFQAIVIYVCVFTLVVAFALPGTAFMMVVGGFFFGLYLGAFLALFAALCGSVLLFLAARTAFGDWLKNRARGGFKTFQRNFHEHAFSYLFFLRVMPIMPFWLVNLAPAFFGINLKTFISATFFGLIPATVIYAAFGQGLGKFLQAGVEPDMNILFEAEIFWPLIGLAVLALLPVWYRRYKERRKEKLANDKKTIHS